MIFMFNFKFLVSYYIGRQEYICACVFSAQESNFPVPWGKYDLNDMNLDVLFPQTPMYLWSYLILSLVISLFFFF